MYSKPRRGGNATIICAGYEQSGAVIHTIYSCPRAFLTLQRVCNPLTNYAQSLTRYSARFSVLTILARFSRDETSSSSRVKSKQRLCRLRIGKKGTRGTRVSNGGNLFSKDTSRSIRTRADRLPRNRGVGTKESWLGPKRKRTKETTFDYVLRNFPRDRALINAFVSEPPGPIDSRFISGLITVTMPIDALANCATFSRRCRAEASWKFPTKTR